MKKKTIVAVDLQAARRKAGLRQLDLAHLLGVSESRVSQMETGTTPPTSKQTVQLSIIYGKPMEAIVCGFLDEVVDTLIERLTSIPAVTQKTSETFNRAHTLSSLAKRLETVSSRRHGGQ